MINRFLFLLAFLVACSVHSQNVREAESLKSLDNTELDNQSRTELYLRIARESSPEEAMLYASKALTLARSHGFKLLEGQALEEISLNHRTYGDITAAFDHSFKALNIYKDLNETGRLADLNEQIGSHYLFDKNYAKAKSYLTSALLEYEKTKDTLDIMMVAINLGECYRVSSSLDSAEYYLNYSLELEQYMRDPLIYSYSLGNIGLVHSSKGQVDRAKMELQEAITILKDLGDPYAASYYQSEIGKIFIDERKYREGELLLKESLEVAKKEGLKEQIRDISKVLSEYYESIGKISPALAYRKQYEDYNDSLLNIDNVRMIESLRADYEIDQKQKEVHLLNRINKNQRTIGYLLALGALVFLGFTFMLYRSNKKINRARNVLIEQKEVISKREDEKALLLKELNHRVKNNLQMIASLLNLQSSQVQDVEAAQALQAGKLRVEALSLIHQKLYSKDHHTTIAIKDYLDELVRNLVHVYNASIKPIIDIDDIQLNIDTAIPLGLIVNELVINALKYAYDDVSDPNLRVSFKSENGVKTLMVADNGIGLKDFSSQKEDSFGLRLTKSLADQIDGNLIFINDNGCKWQLTLT